jgi:hypothetical protein
MELCARELVKRDLVKRELVKRVQKCWCLYHGQWKIHERRYAVVCNS